MDCRVKPGNDGGLCGNITGTCSRDLFGVPLAC
jgi:hypothetical protein